jgi:hypothetical protein
MKPDHLPQTMPSDQSPVNDHEARIAFLFRTTQRQGRIHPLQHLVQLHRAAQAAEAPKVPQ